MITMTRIRQCAVAGVLLAFAAPALAQGPRLQLDALATLAPLASDVTDISLDESMLQLAGGFLSGQDDESAAVKALLSGIKGLYVKTFQFKAGTAAARSTHVDALRRQLTAATTTGGGWSRLVSTQNTNESVDLYAWRERDATGGLALIVAEPNELVVVNIVGAIDLAKLLALQGKFGIPALPLPGAK